MARTKRTARLGSSYTRKKLQTSASRRHQGNQTNNSMATRSKKKNKQPPNNAKGNDNTSPCPFLQENATERKGRPPKIGDKTKSKSLSTNS